MYVLWQYATFYEGATKNYYNTLQNQARLCGRNIDSRLTEFEEYFDYSVFQFREDQLFKLPQNEAKNRITKAFRRFYSAYQNMISGIYFSDGETTFLFEKTVENYFELHRNPQMFGYPGSDKNGYFESDGKLYYSQSIVTITGARPFRVYAQLDIKGLVKDEFSKFYIGKNSYMYLIHSTEIQYIFHSEKQVSLNSVRVDSADIINNQIQEGLEGTAHHTMRIGDEITEVISAFYPFQISDTKFGLVFSIDESFFLEDVNLSFTKVSIAFTLIIFLIVYLFLHIIRQRDKAHRKFKESEKRQLNIIKSLPDTLLIQDEKGSITDIFNDDECLYSYTGKIYLSQPLNETFENISIYSQYRTIYNNFKEKGKMVVGEIKCDDSSFFEVRVSPYGIGKSITIFRNISEIKVAELNLKLAHERFLTVINSIDAVIYVADMHSNEILLINEYAKEKFGEVVGQKCYSALWHNNKHVCDNCINSSLIDHNGYPLKTSNREYFNTNTEEWFRLHDRAIQWYDGRIVKLQISYNITEHKNIIEQLRESEEKFRLIYESLLDVHFRTDIGGKILMVSPSVKKLLDFGPEEIIGKNATLLYFDPNDRNIFVSRILQEGSINDFETFFKKKTGEKIAVSLNSKIVYNSKNHPLHIEGTLRDVTDRNRTIQELKEAKIAAEAADKTKSQFLASMSHELRTPLNGILGYTQILMQDKHLKTHHLEGVNVIHKSGEHLLKLINDILDLSKIDAEKVELEFAPLDLKEMVENIYNIILLKANSKNLELEINYEKIIPERIIQDEKRIQQILLNLLNNAVKFTEKGKIILEIHYRNNFIRFDVIDTGPGIPGEKQEIIFSPFEQLGDHLRKSEGTGLGLAISSKLVKLLGGNLDLESAPGKGSRFTFEVPVEIDSSNGSIVKNEKEMKSAFRGAGKKILIADDNDLNRLVINKMLQKKGLIILEAIDGVDAYKKAREFKPDLILMDKFMPNMDGIESAKKIKSEMKIPIILISATKYDSNESQIKEAGIETTVLKPVKREILYEILSRFLGNEESVKTEIPERVNEKIPENYDLELLIEFIEKRNISRFFKYLDHLEKKDTAFIPFIEKMKQMANGFQMAEIKSILEQKKEEINE
ncbi:MAG: hypothetical protein SCALA702_33570 [Melioribacteraceae bacterium]|nr:MAG: hypothetical protein SCALA702_33570 [Melioribacteraceae bacterium]